MVDWSSAGEGQVLLAFECHPCGSRSLAVQMTGSMTFVHGQGRSLQVQTECLRQAQGSLLPFLRTLELWLLSFENSEESSRKSSPVAARACLSSGVACFPL